MTLYNENEKRKIIMDYYLNKRNRVDSFLDPKYKSVYLHSKSCVDEIELFYNNSNTDFKFIAKGCAIFLSSCEIFIERLSDISFNRKEELILNYQKLINKEFLNQNEQEMLGKLNIYENVSNHLNRKECALMISYLFKKIN